MIRGLIDIVQAVAGTKSLEQLPERRIERLALYAAVLARQGGRQLVAHRAPQMAAALAYRTIFSLVPMMALALVLLNAFYKQDGVERLFGKIFEWTGIADIQVQDTRLADYLETYISSAAGRVSEINFGVIAVVGLGLLIYAALSLVIQIETSFNTICRAPRGRKMMIRLTYYWTILTLGSLGLVLSFTISQAYQSMLTSMPAWALWATLPLQLLTRIGVTWLFLLVAYRLLPNTRVSASYAAVGALVAAVLWEIAKTALTWFVTEMTGNGAQTGDIYGSLAILPVFLLWIYFTWLIVLFGLEVTSAMQWMTHEQVERISLGREEPIGFDPADGVAIMVSIARAFEEGKAVTVEALAEQTGLSGRGMERCIDRFRTQGLIHDVDDGNDASAYSLARPPAKIALRSVLQAGYAIRADEDDVNQDVQSIREMMLDSVEERALSDLLRESE